MILYYFRYIRASFLVWHNTSPGPGSQLRLAVVYTGLFQIVMLLMQKRGGGRFVPRYLRVAIMESTVSAAAPRPKGRYGWVTSPAVGFIDPVTIDWLADDKDSCVIELTSP